MRVGWAVSAEKRAWKPVERSTEESLVKLAEGPNLAEEMRRDTLVYSTRSFHTGGSPRR